MNVRLQLVVIAALAFGALDLGVAQSKAGPSSKILELESKWNEAYKHGDVTTMSLCWPTILSSRSRMAEPSAHPDTLRTTQILRCTWKFQTWQKSKSGCTAM